MKTCERCPEKAVAGERYCKRCRRQVLAELREAGYLRPNPTDPLGLRRKADERELTDETDDDLDD